MPRQANGQYIAPANTAAVSGQAISSTAFNTLETDIGTEITNSLDRGGRSAMTAALPMGGNKVTGAADPTVSTDLATKNYVDTTTAAFFSTGDVKLTLKIVADTGWLLFDDGTFGSGSSGGSNRANNDTLALFTLLYNAPFVDANIPIFTAGGGATTRVAQGSASAAWAANCRMSLPRTLGRALAIAGSGSGLTARVLGSSTGAETSALSSTSQLPLFTPTVASTTLTFPVSATNPGGTNAAALVGNSAPSAANVGGSITMNPVGSANPASFSIMPPEGFLNCMVKL